MNIFVLDIDPWKCARHYCKLHVNKMLLETCQLLCNAYDNAPYRRTHYNHPCSVWARQSKANFNWLEELGNALSAEYTRRTGKIHGCDKILDWIANNEPNVPERDLTCWPQVMPDEFKCDWHLCPDWDYIKDDESSICTCVPEFSNAVHAYRRYYAAKLRDFRKRGLL
jgi:hypothetical protein